ncbi:hypothetical protein Ddc_15334 [Ditylenchus destructor]|nr:hypothetical protein Ddc_15334 [Ditylenchus destructor]
MDIQVVMVSGDPGNPGFGQTTDFPSDLLFGCVIPQTIALSETNPLAKFKDPQMDIQVVMASGDPGNPGFGQATDFPSDLLFGRVIPQTIALSETNPLAKFKDPQMDIQVVMASGDPGNPGFGLNKPFYQSRGEGKMAVKIERAVRYLTPHLINDPEIIEVPDYAMNLQKDGYMCGIHLALNAEGYLLHNGQTKFENFSAISERQRILKILRNYANNITQYIHRNALNIFPCECNLCNTDVPRHNVTKKIEQNDPRSGEIEISYHKKRENQNNAGNDESIKNSQNKTDWTNEDFNEWAELTVISCEDVKFMQSYFTISDSKKDQVMYKHIIRKINKFKQKQRDPNVYNEKRAETKQKRRSNMTDDEKLEYNRKSSESQQKRRSNMTQEEKDRKNQREEKYRSKWYQSNKAKKPLHREAMETIVVERFTVGTFGISKCKNCFALYFDEEHKKNNPKGVYDDCCNLGKLNTTNMHIDKSKEFPLDLKELFIQQDPAFIQNIRRINGDFAFGSMYANTYDFDKTSKYNCYRIHGQVYRSINIAANPNDNSQAKGGQIFFFDVKEAVEQRKNRIKCPDELLKKIEKSIRDNNPYAEGFMSMKEEIELQKEKADINNEPEPDVKLLFGVNPGTDDRTHNLQTVNEVAAVFVPTTEGEIPQAKIVVHEKGKAYQNINHLDGETEALLYPLLKPYGEDGWECTWQKDLQSRKKTLLGNEKSFKKMSLNDYYKFWLAYRDHDKAGFFNPLHLAGRLFQQWIVDQYCRLETDRLIWYRLHQDECKRANYLSLKNWLDTHKTKANAKQIGRMTILPSTFIGGPPI